MEITNFVASKVGKTTEFSSFQIGIEPKTTFNSIKGKWFGKTTAAECHNSPKYTFRALEMVLQETSQ